MLTALRGDEQAFIKLFFGLRNKTEYVYESLCPQVWVGLKSTWRFKKTKESDFGLGI